MKVAFQGVAGAYSELAARRFFGSKAQALPCPEFVDVFRAVKSGRAPYGVLPIENSLTGSIHQNFDLLLRYPVRIGGEVKLRVSHSLLGQRGARIEDLRRIYSHPQALWQCQGKLGKLSRAERVAHFDTAGAARFVAERGDPEEAAVASREAGRRYGLKVLAAAIEDDPHNYTRFVVIHRRKQRVPKLRGRCKSSAAFELESVPGALHASLQPFARLGLQLHKIESRPIAGRPWEYLFYIDFEGDAGAGAPREALRELQHRAERLWFFGSYPSAR